MYVLVVSVGKAVNNHEIECYPHFGEGLPALGGLPHCLVQENDFLE